MLVKAIMCMQRDQRAFGIESFVGYFLGIMSILVFFYFVIFPNRCNTLILQSCTLFSK